MNDKKIILASASPRRQELLSILNIKFEVIPAQIEEDIKNKPFTNNLIENLAIEKAKDVQKRVSSPSIIIAADTVVVIGDEILGKPKDDNDAKRMLNLLSDSTHQVVSAIAVIDTESNKILADSVNSEVTFKKLSNIEIEKYINTREPMDKAGAYAIQGLGSVFVESISGCYFNIVGISIFKLAQMLQQFGINVL